jgi:hypothetical protein
VSLETVDAVACAVQSALPREKDAAAGRAADAGGRSAGRAAEFRLGWPAASAELTAEIGDRYGYRQLREGILARGLSEKEGQFLKPTTPSRRSSARSASGTVRSSPPAQAWSPSASDPPQLPESTGGETSWATPEAATGSVAGLDDVMRSYDGRGSSTALTAVEQQRWPALPDAYMNLQAESERVSIVADFACAVCELAPHDAVAHRIIVDGAAELVDSATAALQRAECSMPKSETGPGVVPIGVVCSDRPPSSTCSVPSSQRG